ncbi:MAG: hypothetical protein IJD14_05075 [Christensenellaceae bacterium]|nr:hypothetical protein [Christensenellaceae bacterium]
MKRMIVILLAFIILLLPVFAFAASVEIDSKDCTVGDNIGIHVVIKSEKIGAVNAEFRYDSDKLQLLESNNISGANGIGKIVMVAGSENMNSLSCTINFMAIDSGYAAVSVTTTTLLSYDETIIKNAEGSCVINIASNQKPSPSPSVAASPSPSAALPSPSATVPGKVSPSAESTNTFAPAYDSEKSIAVHVDGKKLNMALTLDNIPSGFVSKHVDFNHNKIETAYSKELDLTLAYLYDNNKKDGSYYSWDIEKGTFKRMMHVSGDYLLLDLPDSLPDELKQYKKSEILFPESSTDALYAEHGLMIIYACHNEECSYYYYDPSDGSIQRYHGDLTAVNFEGNSSDVQTHTISLDIQNDSKYDLLTILSYILCALAGILLIIFVIIVITKKSNHAAHSKRGVK